MSTEKEKSYVCEKCYVCEEECFASICEKCTIKREKDMKKNTCYICGEDCNWQSQTCGHCARLSSSWFYKIS